MNKKKGAYIPKVSLQLVKEAPVRLKYPKKAYTNPELVLNAINELCAPMAREEFGILCFDIKMHLICCSIVTTGTINACLVDSASVFRTALLANATNIIAFHNHPSGDCQPSEEDLAVTRKLAAAGFLIEIPLLDHIICNGNGEFYSFREEQYHLLEEKPELDLHW